MTERIVLWEHEAAVLDAPEADLLEDACQRIWKDRRHSPTYESGELAGSTSTSLAQSLIRFDRSRDGTVSVTPRNYIGLVRVAHRHYVILPKIYRGLDENLVGQLLRFQFGYAYGLHMPESPQSGTGLGPVLELFAESVFHSFSCATLEILRRHSYLSYQEVHDNIQTVRGRIDFSRHLKDNVSHARYDRFHCVYELYQEDSLFPRILKHVTGLVRERSRLKSTQMRLTEILMLLDDVADQPCSYKDCLRVRFTRYQQEFVPILQHCALFLSSRMADSTEGEFGIDHVLIDTNALFERFVCGYLKVEGAEEWQVEPRRRGHVAADELGDLFLYENDALLTRKSDGSQIIVDMKYKTVDLDNRTEKYGISQADLYQMISYAIKRGITDVLMVFPGIGGAGSSYRRLIVPHALGDRPISVTACQIPMRSTGKKDIAEVLRQATNYLQEETQTEDITA